MKSAVLAVLALAGPVLATSYQIASPPDTFNVTLPNDVVALGQNVTLRCSTPILPEGESITALVYNTSITVRIPNGTIVDIGGVNSGAGCTSPLNGRAAGGFTLETDKINQSGTYTVMWNQTYGTVPNVSDANATTCNTFNPLSYQTWILSSKFTVVMADPNAPTPALTDTVFTLSPAPTGKILVSNGAQATAMSVAMVIGAVGVAVLRLL